MQLDPTKSFKEQISNLKGTDFENIVAATFFYAGYHIERNVILTIDKDTIAEIDIVGSLITPLNEIRIAIECKGAKPNFADMRKFSTVKQLLSGFEFLVDMIVFGSDDTREAHDEIARKLQLKLLKKADLGKLIFAIQGSDVVTNMVRKTWINRYLVMFTIENYYLKTIIDGIKRTEVKKEFNSYIKYLYADLWSISDPIEQINDSFIKSQEEFYGFTDTIAGFYKTSALREVKKPENEVVQAAMFLELKHRIVNLYGIIRCSVIAKNRQGIEVVSERTPAIKQALISLCDYNIAPSKFMSFITRFISLWGGCIIKYENGNDVENTDHELKIMADESGISLENAHHFLEIFKRIYTSNLFNDSDSIFFMKYVPAAFRGMGVVHRDSISIDASIFNDDDLNLHMLNNSLLSIGGIEGLKIKVTQE
ncbi:MAG TPA: hypothetical protein VK151_08555 [Fluviicola sp.]|nr:hypothetical protein [Fluviicola sp.]